MHKGVYIGIQSLVCIHDWNVFQPSIHEILSPSDALTLWLSVTLFITIPAGIIETKITTDGQMVKRFNLCVLHLWPLRIAKQSQLRRCLQGWLMLQKCRKTPRQIYPRRMECEKTVSDECAWLESLQAAWLQAIMQFYLNRYVRKLT